MADRRTKRPRRRGWLRKLGRALGDAFLMGGIGRGLVHGADRQGSGDHLLARAVLFDEGARDRHAPDQIPGLLERVPGWVVLVALAILVALALTILRPA
jgi:hypothetical protein